VPGSGQLPAGPAVDLLARQVGVAVVAGRYLPPWASASRAATPRRPATAAVSSWSSIYRALAARCSRKRQGSW